MEKTLKSLNAAVMRFDPRLDMNTNPRVHLGICGTLLQLRQDIYQRGLLNLQSRRRKLRELMILDYLQEDKELREVDRAYINTQP